MRRHLGQDLRSDPRPEVTEALKRAEASGSLSRTPVIDLFQGGKGFATYEPLRNGTGEQLGFANCVFRINDLMDSCLSEPELRDRFRFEVLDSFGHRAYLHPLDDKEEQWPLAVALQVRVVDRPWTMRFAPMPDVHLEPTLHRRRAPDVGGLDLDHHGFPHGECSS